MVLDLPSTIVLIKHNITYVVFDTFAVIFLSLTFSSFKVWFCFFVATAKKLDGELCFGLFFFTFFLYFWKDSKSGIIKKYGPLWNFFLMGCISYNSSTSSEIQVAPKSVPVGWACSTLVGNTTTNTYCTDWKKT